MGDPVTIGIGLTVLSTAFGAYSSISQGNEAARAAEVERKNLEIDSAVARANAEQDRVSRLKDLRSVLSTQSALQSGRGIDLYSGSALAIRKGSEAEAASDLRAIGARSTIEQSRLSIAQSEARRRGKTARKQGLFGAADQIIAGGTRIYDLKTKDK